MSADAAAKVLKMAHGSSVTWISLHPDLSSLPHGVTCVLQQAYGGLCRPPGGWLCFLRLATLFLMLVAIFKVCRTEFLYRNVHRFCSKQVIPCAMAILCT